RDVAESRRPRRGGLAPAVTRRSGHRHRRRRRPARGAAARGGGAPVVEPQILSVPAQGAPPRVVRRGRRVPRLAQAGNRRLHRAEQAVRHSRGRPAVHRRRGSVERSGAGRPRVRVRTAREPRRSRRAGRCHRDAAGRSGGDEDDGAARAGGGAPVRSPYGRAGVLRPVRARHGSGARRMIKRLFDAALAGAGLILSSPLWALIALAVKLEDGGPVFFRQDRVGLNGRVFRALKFRSMVPDAEKTSGPVQATAGDPRVTRVGRLLRATAMDELPQLWNIFVGDMSFVGPRPLRPGEVDARGDGRLVALDQIPGYAERHRVRPGLTGLTQVYAPRDISRASKFRPDRLYLRRGGFCLDLKLILLSFWITGRGEWEARDRRV